MSDDIDDTRPLRVMVFPQRPDVLLVYIPEGQTFWVPPLTTPLQKVSVAQAFRDRDIPVKVVESVPGRFTTSIRNAISDDKALRGSIEKQRIAAKIARLETSTKPVDQQRAELLVEKNTTDQFIRNLKRLISDAKSNAFTTGTYLDREHFRKLNQQLVDAQTKSLSLQNKLGQLRKVQTLENCQRFEARFIELVKELLDPDEFEELVAEARGSLNGT